MFSIKHYLLAFAWLATIASHAQSAVQPPTRMSVATFLNIVNTHDDIAKAQSAVQMAKVDIELASASPSPTLTFGNACGDVSGISMPHQLYAGLDFTIETGGKKKNRIHYSQAQADLARVEYEIFVRNFRREALMLYNTCWLEETHIATLTNYHDALAKMTTADSISALQKSIALKKLQLDIAALEETFHENIIAFNELIGSENTIVYPEGPAWNETNDIIVADPKANDLTLMQQDLSSSVAHRELALAQSNQRGDYTLSLGNSFMTRARNTEAPSPAYNAVTATISIPIRFTSNKSNTHMNRLKKEALDQQTTVTSDDLKKKWQQLRQQKHKLTEEIKIITELLNDQLKLMNIISVCNTANISNAEELCALARRKQDKEIALAKINGEIFWHNDTPRTHLIANTK
ncbi:TolC family protein [Pseudochryseolinea flava]|uniref:TolC family protein n=1 Tax=Pseudochryseolinea flava TaxID=2059302 RepID=A0A364Y2H8_9BACT|nr:TolC family protein [Pseudochryseolinea flava]RAW00512.1 hypothetical protein DQQ10_13000 [Pseudochryseolinea flava]